MSKKYLLGISAYQNSDLLEKCIRSIPSFIDYVIFFDGKNWQNIFQDLINKLNSFSYLTEYDHVGVGGAWNKILEHAFVKKDYDAVIILGSDCELKEGYLEGYIKEFEEGNFEFATGRGVGFNCFCMTKKCYETVGEFDLNLFPCYYEDNCMATRVRISKLAYGDVGNPDLFWHYGSAVIRKDERFNKANGITFPMNQRYYVKKWGIKDLSKMDEYSYLTPFNDPNLTIKDWTLDKQEYEYKKKIWNF